MKKTKADFTHEIMDGVLVIIDWNLGNMSVTNDMEAVLAACEAKPGSPIIYVDSEAMFDGVELMEDGNVRFYPLRTYSMREAIAKAKARFPTAVQRGTTKGENHG